jgi:hypothetical protein
MLWLPMAAIPSFSLTKANTQKFEIQKQLQANPSRFDQSS